MKTDDRVLPTTALKNLSALQSGKEARLRDSMHMTFCKGESYRDRKHIGGRQRLGAARRVDSKGEPGRVVSEVWNFFLLTVVVVTQVYALSPLEKLSAKSKNFIICKSYLKTPRKRTLVRELGEPGSRWLLCH